MKTIKDFCGNGIDCPALHWKEDGRVIASGPTITDPAILRELALPDHESAVEFSEDVIWRARATRLDLAELSAYIDQHCARHVFRMETLSHYTADSDGDDFQRYLRGESAPDAAAKRSWLNRLRTDTAAGRRWQRVHAVRLPLTDYLCYEFEWAYVDNVANGEAVRIFHDFTGSLLRLGDFFVLDGEHVVRSSYDHEGRFVHADVLHDTTMKAPYIALHDLAWRVSEPFTDWWLKHPHYHRANRAA